MTRHVSGQPSRSSRFLKRLPLYLGVLLISAIAVFPLLWSLAASLSPNEQVFANTFPFSWRALVPVDFTLEAYEALFSERGFLRPIINTTVLGLITVFVGGLIAAMAGFAFATFDFRFKNLLFIVVLLTFMVPPEVTIIPLYSMIDRAGWVNTWQALLLPGLANALIVFLFRQFFADIATRSLRRWPGRWRGLVPDLLLHRPAHLQARPHRGGPGALPQRVGAVPLASRGRAQAEFRDDQVAISLSIGQYQVLWNQLMAGAMIAALIPILLILPFQKYYISGLAGTGSKEG